MKHLFAVVAFALIFVAPASADILSAPPKVDVLILGEVHDNPIHHANQVKALRAFSPAAVVYEMLSPDQAGRVLTGPAQDPEQLEELLDWSNSGWPAFEMYYPVLTAVPSARVYGAALPRADVRRAVGEGAAAVFGSGAGRYGLHDPLAEAEQNARNAGQMAAHCNALPEAMLGGMVEAQRLRDAWFADTVLTALSDTGGPVAVIAGSGHARTDWGVPAALSRAAPQVTVFALGQIEGENETGVPFDAVIITGAAEREDPCAAFLKSRPKSDG